MKRTFIDLDKLLQNCRSAEIQPDTLNQDKNKISAITIETEPLLACIVEAIPVEYLKERASAMSSKAYRNCLIQVIADWEADNKDDE